MTVDATQSAGRPTIDSITMVLCSLYSIDIARCVDLWLGRSFGVFTLMLFVINFARIAGVDFSERSICGSSLQGVVNVSTAKVLIALLLFRIYRISTYHVYLYVSYLMKCGLLEWFLVKNCILY